MRADPRRSFARFWGLFMLLVQLRVVYKFIQSYEDELDRTPYVSMATVIQRMSWLKPWPWTAHSLSALVLMLGVGLVALLVALWTYGLLQLRRGSDD